ncbi:TraB/GumN family protein [Phaeobacter marinintestinus]|uniref:TraB/GumN family protein n=1 Tax=Falsiphaeobacter marinintestinus TaxID=1492905 RepID=UPI0016468508|nr:TraB/GumN family protein [Phaeobacter marinintestinus]
MARLIAALTALLLMTVSVQAGCSGTDLREALSESDLQEIRAVADATPFAQGNHWIAKRGGQTVHLIGTLHLNDPRMADIAKRLAPVIRQADLLLLEVNQDAFGDFMKSSGTDMSGLLLTSGPTLIDVMGDEKWQKFSIVLKENQIPPMMAAKMRPWLLDQMLSLPPCLRKAKDAVLGMDKRLEQIAIAADVPVASLETVAELLDILNSRPLEQQVDDLLTSIAMYGSSMDMHATMAEGYFDEDVVFIMELVRRTAATLSIGDPDDWDARWNAFIAALLIERNNRWMTRIPAFDQPNLVIAVGAAHLSGSSGLLNQLQDQGFLLERAAF